MDFERQTLAEGLAAAGFDPERQTFFMWLGVVPYLSEDAVWSTLTYVASLPGGAHVVFDYGDPPATLSAEARLDHDRRAARVEALGETWITYFEADRLRAKLTTLGYAEIEDVGPRQIVERFFSMPADGLADRGGHVVRATTIRSPRPPGTHARS